MEQSELHALAKLIVGQRTGSLGTLEVGGGAPYVSLVLYAPEPDLTGFLVHLSRLALHTRNLRTDPRASLMIAEPDTGGGDPQTLMRVSLQGTAVLVRPDAPEHAAARAAYLDKFPGSAPIFDLGDFELYRLVPRVGRFIAAFGRIINLTADHLRLAGRLESHRD
jgi:putative heme iron utilization protein